MASRHKDQGWEKSLVYFRNISYKMTELKSVRAVNLLILKFLACFGNYCLVIHFIKIFIVLIGRIKAIKIFSRVQEYNFIFCPGNINMKVH